MQKPVIAFGGLSPLSVQQYERYLPTAFDESLTILEKVNKTIIYMNQIGELSNNVLDQWNKVMEWVMNDGLEDSLIAKLNEWLENGTLENILQEILSNLQTNMDALSASFNTFKNDVNNALAKTQSIVTITNPNDITNDVKTALEKVKNGGVLFIPYGDYTMSDYVELYPNVKVTAPKGTIIRKTLTSASGYSFIAGKTNGTTGYGGGGKNITIENITFIGFPQDGTSYMPNALAFNHIDDLTLRNLSFIDCMFNGHCIDLGGCSNVLIEHSVFSGHYLIVGREFTEAIQIDSSTPDGMGSDWSGLDGLPTKDVVVQYCEFIPSTISPAPNPIGNHGFTGTKFYENIVFDHNKVVDGHTSEDASWRGWVHFYATKNLKITNNHFINTNGSTCNVIQLLTSSGGRYDPVTMVAGTGEPMQMKDIEISGNTFEGFNTVSNAYMMIRGYGTTYNSISYPIEDVNVHDNQFINCGTDTMNVDEGNLLIHIYHFLNVIVKGNKADKGQILASVWDGRNAVFANNIGKKMCNALIYTADNSNVTINNNIGDRVRRPIECEEIIGLSCNGNIATDILIKNAENYAYKFRNVSNAQINNNVAQSNTGDISYGYYIYDTMNQSKNINNFDNIGDGFLISTYGISGSANFVNYQTR